MVFGDERDERLPIIRKVLGAQLGVFMHGALFSAGLVSESSSRPSPHWIPNIAERAQEPNQVSWEKGSGIDL